MEWSGGEKNGMEWREIKWRAVEHREMKRRGFVGNAEEWRGGRLNGV